MAYATLEELRVFVGIPADDETDDAVLQVALDAAAGQVDAYTGRRFTADEAPTTRYYTATDPGHVRVDPLQTAVGLVVATDDTGDGSYSTAWTLGDDYRLTPVNSPSTGRPWTGLARSTAGPRSFPRGELAVEVTATFGWTEIPAAVHEATLLQASRLFVRRQAPFGVAGSPDIGSEVRLLARLDPDVEALLRPYRRTWAIVTSSPTAGRLWPWPA